MLQDSKAFSSFSTDNIDKAKEFYGDILELNVSTNPMGMIELHFAGGNPVVIYPKREHKPATFTVLNFPVENIDKAVDELIGKGLKMQFYEGFDQDEKGIVRSKDPKEGPSIAWFKDPAENILAVLEE